MSAPKAVALIGAMIGAFLLAASTWTQQGASTAKAGTPQGLGQGSLVTADSSVGTTSPLGGFGATGGVPSGINT